MIIGDFLVPALKQLIPGKGFYYVGDILNEKSFYEKFNVIVGSDENGSAILSNNRDDFGVTWEKVSDKIAELRDAEPMRLLREERNKKLQETDWTQYRDVSLSNDSDWQTYRQSLRDLPQNFSPIIDIITEDGYSIVKEQTDWPEKPS